MPRDLFLRHIDLDLCYPPFLDKLLEAKAAAKARGAQYITTELFRSMDRSDALYILYKKGGNRAAAAGFSGHNFGIASDEALIVKPGPPREVRFDKDSYKILYEELAKVGLTNGSGYHDYPHVEIPGFVTADELKPLRDVWYSAPLDDQKTRLQKVWRYLDSCVTFG